ATQPTPSGRATPSTHETATAARSPNMVTGVNGSGTWNGRPAEANCRNTSTRRGMAAAASGRLLTRTAATPGISSTWGMLPSAAGTARSRWTPGSSAAAISSRSSTGFPSAEAAQPQAVADHEDRGERHRGAGDHRVEQAQRGQRQGGHVVGERPEQVALDGA